MPPLISQEEFERGRAKVIAADHFLVVAARVEPLIQRLNSFDVHPASLLAADDRASRTDAVSHQARALLSVGADHVSTLAEVMVKAEVLPAFAGFTLLRNTAECAGVCLWLIGPADRDQRVLRALQLSRESLNDSRRLEAASDGKEFKGLAADDPILKRFTQERDARPMNVGIALKPPSITERLEAAEQYVTRYTADQETLLTQWQRASGLAHGRRHAVWRNSDARLRSWDHVGFRAVVTGDIVVLTSHFESAVNYLEDGISLLEKRGAPA